MKLSKDKIDNERYKGDKNARHVIWCNDPIGLGLRVYPSGRKAFVVSYRNKSGTKRLAVIGDYGVFTLDQARAQARKIIYESEIGGDALAIRKQNRAAPTFGALCDAYIERHVPRLRSGKQDVRRISKHLAVWRTRKLESIDREDVRGLVAKIGAHHVRRLSNSALLNTRFQAQ